LNLLGVKSKKRIGILIALMIGVTLIISSISIHLLYNVFLEQAKTRLTELVQNQVDIIESVTKFYEQNRPPKDKYANTPGGIASIVVERLLASQRKEIDFGKTGKYYIGFVMDEKVYTLHDGQQFEAMTKKKDHQCVIGKSVRAASQNKKGIMIGNRLEGDMVMSAYYPIPSLQGFAMVATIDISEIKDPFIRVSLILALVSLLVISLAVIYFYRVSEPIIAEVVSKKRYMRSLLMSIFYGVVGLDSDGSCRFFNKSFFDVLDVEGDEKDLIGKNIGKIIYDNLSEGDKEKYTPVYITNKCLSDGKDAEKITLTTKNGKKIEIIAKEENAISGEDVDVRVTSIMDVTELYYKNKEIVENNRLLDMRINHLKSLYALTDLSSIPMDSLADIMQKSVDLIANNFFQRPDLICISLKIFGKTCQTQNYTDTKYKIEQPIFSKGHKVGRITVCYKADWSMGGQLFLEEEKDLLKEAASRIEIMGNRIAADEKLRQVQKMEAIGTLAGGVAHDFNNIITGIQGHAFIAKDKIGKNHIAEKNVVNVLDACKKAAGLVAQLLGFSRKGEVSKARVSMNGILEEVVSLARVSAQGIVDFNMDLGDEEFYVFADSNQIYQIILNLTSNSVDAIKSKDSLDRGNINIGLSRVDTDFVEVNALEAFPTGRYLKISVEDNGIGMDDKIVEKIFDPFFTTKEFGKGTGLGLSVVHGIIYEHGGTVDVKSHAGIGTSFYIYLPEDLE
jgi:signal transduction histidine kinase